MVQCRLGPLCGGVNGFIWWWVSLMLVMFSMSQLRLRHPAYIKWSTCRFRIARHVLHCCLHLRPRFTSSSSPSCFTPLVSPFIFFSRLGWGHHMHGLFVWSCYGDPWECVTVCVLMPLCVCVICAGVMGLQFCFMRNDLIQTQTPTYQIRLLPRIV